MAMVLVAAMRISEVFLPWQEWLPGSFYQVIYDLIKSIGIPLASGSTGLETYVATTNNLLSILLIVAFTALYSTTGGLRSVIVTDTVQFSLAMLGTMIYAIIVVIKSGGVDDIVAKLVKLYGNVEASRILSFSPNTMEAFKPFLVIYPYDPATEGGRPLWLVGRSFLRPGSKISFQWGFGESC
jgi:hypothetical protein